MPVVKPKINQEMNVGEILERYPQAREVFLKHFGEDCFNCPSSRRESLLFSALMHKKDAEVIVKELNAFIK